MDTRTKKEVIAVLLKQNRPDLIGALDRKLATAQRKQVVFLGNTGPNGAREWVIVQFYDRPYGNGEKIAKVSTRLGVEPQPNQPVQWTDIPYMRTYLKNVRNRLTRPGIILLNKLATASTRIQAGTWQEKAKAELEAELGGIETKLVGGGGRDFIRLESVSGRANNGESEWMVFKDAKAAEQYAIEYVKDMLEDDPSMFDQKWLKQHVFVSPNDIRLISQEDADSYVDDIRSESEERLLDEAGMLQAWQSLETKKDALNDKLTGETDPTKMAALQKQVDAMEAAQEKLVDKADDKLRAELEKRTADQLNKDPLAWAEELGFDFERQRPPWLKLDERKAAVDAVNTDGVAHFLDGYDGEEVELDSGAVAFGTN